MSDSRVTGVACILEQSHYAPGAQPPDGYLEWHEWAAAQHEAGLRQKQCGRCGLWRFPQELSCEMIQWRGFTSRGKAVDKTAALCKTCAE